MADGKLILEVSKERIDNEILPEKEFENPSEAIGAMFKWAIPHWDWVVNSRIGAVKVNQSTAEYLIGRLRMVGKGDPQECMMLWLNYGWSVQADLKDWVIQIDFSKIDYKEVE